MLVRLYFKRRKMNCKEPIDKYKIHSQKLAKNEKTGKSS